jgi:hypothetical protein
MHAFVLALVLAIAQEPTPTVEELVRRGRESLAREDPAEAEALFIEAEVRSGKAIAVRKWVWRAWMQGGRINDALDAVDAIEPRAELPQADLDYLRGMAFFFRGRTYIDQEVGEPYTSAAFRDAMEWLDAATRADPEQYHDAWLPLAECAWHSHEYAIGRNAAEAARRRFPDDPHGGLLLGRLLFQRYLELATDPAQREAADGLWKELIHVLEETRETVGKPADEAARTLAADCWLQLGYAYDQKAMLIESTAAFAEASALWPAGTDYQDLWGRFAPSVFRDMIEAAVSRAASLFAAEAEDDAVLWWWLGSARYGAESWSGAAEAFERGRQARRVHGAWYWPRARRSRGRSRHGPCELAHVWVPTPPCSRRNSGRRRERRAWIHDLGDRCTRRSASYWKRSARVARRGW